MGRLRATSVILFRIVLDPLFWQLNSTSASLQIRAFMEAAAAPEVRLRK